MQLNEFFKGKNNQRKLTESELVARHGLTTITKKADHYVISHTGNMSNTVDNSVKPNVDAMLGAGAFDHLQAGGREDGSPDYMYTLKVPAEHFDAWQNSDDALDEVTRRDMPDMNAGWQVGPRRKISVRKAIEVLSRYAERELQKELRWAKGDEEMEADARDAYQQYVKLIDLMKMGDLDSAKQFWNDDMNHILVNDSTFPVTVRDVLESELTEGNPESKQKRRTIDRTVGQNWMDQQNSFSDFERKTTSPIRMGRGVNRFAKSGTYKALAKGEMAEAEGFPYDVDHMPGKTTKHTNTNCTTCHGRKAMYKLDGKLYADNKVGATKVKCSACKGTGDKQGVAEGAGNYYGFREGQKVYVFVNPENEWQTPSEHPAPKFVLATIKTLYKADDADLKLNNGKMLYAIQQIHMITPKEMDKLKSVKGVAEGANDAELDASKILKLLDGLWRWLHNQGIPSQTRHPGRVWTRGDGVRWRDPAKLMFSEDEACDRAWALITALPGTKPASVSGEFGSSAYRDAVLWKNKLLIKNSHSIEIGTKSRITNPRSVWREKPHTNEASEKFAPGTEVMFAHKGKATSGKVVRYDAGTDGGSPFYVVSVKGEYESPIVPAHRVKPVQTAQLGEVDMGQADRTLRSGTRGDSGKMAHIQALRKAAEQMGYSHWADVPDSELDQLQALAKKIKGFAEGNMSEDSDWELEPIDKQDDSAGEHRQQYPFHNIKKESARMANPPAGMSAREYAQHERGRAPKPKLRVGAKVSTPRASGTVKAIYTKQLASSGKTAQFMTVVDRQGAEHEVRVRDVTVQEGYTVIPKIDAERYGPRDGLEGPFTARNGLVVYYDPQVGQYYDPNTDIYIDHEDWHLMNEADQVSEGPFKGVGKMMMKRKLKKGEADSMKRAETAYFDHDDQDEFMAHMADRRKKEKALNRLTREEVEQIDEAIQWTKPKNDEHDEVYIQLDAVERGEEYPEHVHAMLKHLANRSNFQGAMKKAKPMTITHKDLQPGGKYAEMSNTEANESEPNISDLNQTKVRRVKKIFNNAMKHGTPMERPIVLYDTHTGHTHLLAGNTRLTYNTHYGSGSTVVHAIKYDSSKMNEEVEQIDEISAKTLATAAHLASDPDADYAYDKPHDANKFAKHATKKFGSKIGSQIAKAASGAGHFPKEYGTSGKQAPYTSDRLADRTPNRVTAAGKVHKQDASSLKDRIKMDARRKQREIGEEVKQVDEISPALKKSYIAKAPKTVAPLVDRGRELRLQGDEEAGMKKFDKAANRVTRLNRLHNQELDQYRKQRDSTVHFALRDGKDPDAK